MTALERLLQKEIRELKAKYDEYHKVSLVILENRNELMDKLAKLTKKIDEENTLCDCEYGGCRHSFANELWKMIK